MLVTSRILVVALAAGFAGRGDLRRGIAEDRVASSQQDRKDEDGRPVREV